MVNLLKANTKFSLDFFRGVAHRSSTVSSFFLFMCTQLMGIQDPSIQTYIRSNEFDLLGNIRLISFSKFSHVQVSFCFIKLFTIKRLYISLLLAICIRQLLPQNGSIICLRNIHQQIHYFKIYMICQGKENHPFFLRWCWTCV